MRLPIIVSDVDTFSNLCKQNKSALVINNSTDAWYNTLKKLINDDALRTELATNAYEELKVKHILDGMPIL